MALPARATKAKVRTDNCIMRVTKCNLLCLRRNKNKTRNPSSSGRETALYSKKKSEIRDDPRDLPPAAVGALQPHVTSMASQHVRLPTLYQSSHQRGAGKSPSRRILSPDPGVELQ